jgi:hypothetical protein
MKSVDGLTSNSNKPRLGPTFKQPERNLLSVFMSLLEVVPLIRGEFLKKCGYSSGRTCNYQSHMEVGYNGHKMSDVRPDGLFACQRGNSDWAAFIEAKAGKSPIRPEQIIEYLALAGQVDVETVITISNEFARMPTELPYHVATTKRRKCDVYHFAWADIRTFLESQKSNPELIEVEVRILSECLEFFWEETCGILTYDAMPPDWPKFVESSGTALGFGSKTAGITEIVHGWLQERRDLCSKLVHETRLEVDLGHEAGVRADKDLRLKVDRKMLADSYCLTANYIFKRNKVKLNLLADLRSCKTTLTLEIAPPPNKKAKAVVNWIVTQIEVLELADAFVFFDWKGRGNLPAISVSELLANPEAAYEGQKEAPKTIQIIRDKHDVRRFKGRKLFIEDLENLTIATVKEVQKAGWLG